MLTCTIYYRGDIFYILYRKILYLYVINNFILFTFKYIFIKNLIVLNKFLRGKVIVLIISGNIWFIPLCLFSLYLDMPGYF